MNNTSKTIYSVRKHLLHEILAGEFKTAERLPRENILAEKLKISRTQLRDSLAQLEREGFINRIHGVGTVINRHVVNIKVRMDIEVEFNEMISNSGYTPEVNYLGFKKILPEALVAKKLQITLNDEVIRVSRLIKADHKPAIYCDDYFSTALIKTTNSNAMDFAKPIFDFLKIFCQIEPCLDITEVSAVPATSWLANIFSIPHNSPLLFLDEVDFDLEGMPILYSQQYYVDCIIKHTILRKKF